MKMRKVSGNAMQFQATCPECNEKVTTSPKTDGGNLDHAFENDEDVAVVGFLCGHNWNLNAQDKANLSKMRSGE
jgi:hypothetical protein